MKPIERIALVTGANRGIGHEIVRQLVKQKIKVILSARNEEKGKVAAHELGAEFRLLDVTNEQSIRTLHANIVQDFGRLDILVNNAGIFLDGREGPNPESVRARLRKTLETNVYGPYDLCELFMPLMKKNGYGRIVNLSSGMGQLTEMEGGSPSYRISKTALNAVTRIFANEGAGANVLVNSMCPGWVKTDMGGAGAERTVEQGADTAVWLATLPEDGPTGGFFRDRKKIQW